MNDKFDEPLLTDAELASLEAEVQKEIDKEAKAKAREQTKKSLLNKARVARGLAEASEDVLIDLPLSANQILVNNFPYRQGQQYTVKASIAMMLRESMQRAWQHQAEIEGRSKDFFQRVRGTRMSGTTGAVTGAPFLKG